LTGQISDSQCGASHAKTFWHTGGRCQLSGDIEAERLQPKASFSYGSLSPTILPCMAWSSAPRHLGSRDRHIGWSSEARRRNIRFVAYNTRFLILPWVEIPQLASHILGRILSSLSNDWEQLYGHPVYFAETVIDQGRFRGTCYRAANWKLLGLTTGRGKDSTSKRPNRSIKEVLGYPLTPRFRE